MKKILLILLVVFIFTDVNAQENVVKVNPVGLLFGSAQFSYERVLNQKSSLELSLGYSSQDVRFKNLEEENLTGFGIEAKYKLYFSKREINPRGVYFAPLASYSNISGNNNANEEGKVSIISAGALGGYQWIIGGMSSGFSIDLNLGVQYSLSRSNDEVISLTSDGFVPRLGLSFGYAW